MIYLHSVSKTVFAKHNQPKLVLRPTTIALPTDRRVAILGNRQQGKSTLLRLLAGFDPPDTGEVIADLKFSPIGNSRSIFHPRLSTAENVRLFSRSMGMDVDYVLTAVDALCNMGDEVQKPSAFLSGPQRQLLEIALLSVLPFDCYLLDDAFRMPKSLLERYFDAAERRGAGMIFTTIVPRQVYEYADFAVVIRDNTVQAFSHAEEAIETHER
jgi:ABC-type polysaccharide/polyol phosphate transport system ATPase subunit